MGGSHNDIPRYMVGGSGIGRGIAGGRIGAGVHGFKVNLCAGRVRALSAQRQQCDITLILCMTISPYLDESTEGLNRRIEGCIGFCVGQV